MSKQPEALRLADAMDAVNKNNADSLLVQMAARSASAELRRLHALNAELVEALKKCQFALEPYDDIKPRDWKTDRERLAVAHQVAIEALSKAEGREA